MYESHPDWAPSLHLGPRHPLEKDAEDHTEEPAGNHTEPEPASIVVELTEEAAGWAEGEPVLKELSECDFCRYRRTEINRLLNENRELKCALAKRKMDEESLKEDDAKVKYYTGLPCFGLLMGLLSTVMPYLPTSFRTLSPFQMVFLTLMRLRLNLPLQHLAGDVGEGGGMMCAEVMRPAVADGLCGLEAKNGRCGVGAETAEPVGWSGPTVWLKTTDLKTIIILIIIITNQPNIIIIIIIIFTITITTMLVGL
ncbi:hypothetical protein CRUP_024126 [Coryphaenoides rupestris]|nr:hypothetical protein CRUP_024126 [Coryphaenoides rupestris]